MPFPRFCRVDDFKLSTLYVSLTIFTRPATFNCDIMYGLKIPLAYCSNVVTPTDLSLCTTAAPSKMTALIPYGDSRTKGTSVSKQVSSSDFAENRILPESDNDGGKVWFSCLKNSSTLLPLFWHPIYSLEKRAVSFFATLANDILINSLK